MKTLLSTSGTWTVGLKARLFFAAFALSSLVACEHDPNRGIDREQAKAAAERVHRRPTPAETKGQGPGFGG